MAITTRACPLCIAMLVASLLHTVARAAEPDQKPIHITGRVVDSAGQPIKGVICFWVWSRWSDWDTPTGELVSEAVSDSDGRFELKEN